MIFCQFANSTSVRDISNGLKSATGNLNHLGIRETPSTSQNAVEIQLWTALITILMLKYLQFKASYDWNLSNLVASLRLNTFTKMDLWSSAAAPTR
jgi:hypothetical protein